MRLLGGCCWGPSLSQMRQAHGYLETEPSGCQALCVNLLILTAAPEVDGTSTPVYAQGSRDPES